MIRTNEVARIERFGHFKNKINIVINADCNSILANINVYTGVCDIFISL